MKYPLSIQIPISFIYFQFVWSYSKLLTAWLVYMEPLAYSLRPGLYTYSNSKSISITIIKTSSCLLSSYYVLSLYILSSNPSARHEIEFTPVCVWIASSWWDLMRKQEEGTDRVQAHVSLTPRLSGRYTSSPAPLWLLASALSSLHTLRPSQYQAPLSGLLMLLPPTEAFNSGTRCLCHSHITSKATFHRSYFFSCVSCLLRI